MSSDDSITAVDYIARQLELEREAKELMPFSSDECTYEKGELRQPVFACLDCSRKSGQDVGVCYSCSIQCHLSHEIVELFAKRNYVCDCGTTRMSNIENGACKLRLKIKSDENTSSFVSRTGSISGGSRQRTSSSLSITGISLPAEDIPSSSNCYNHNFKGLFCSCDKPYNPLDGNMIQCYFGFECGEDWFHEECILGFNQGFFVSPNSGKNLFDDLPPPGEDAATDHDLKREIPVQEIDTSHDEGRDTFDDDDLSQVPNFPSLSSFDCFICWKCVNVFKHLFQKIDVPDIVLTKLPHFESIESVDHWNEKYKLFKSSSISIENDGGLDESSRKRKAEPIESNPKRQETDIPYSLFLKNGFKDHLLKLYTTTEDSKLKQFLQHNEYLFKDDPVYEPPEDADADANSSNTGSLLDLGTDALLSLPKEQAIEGLHAYNKIREKLKDFFKPFAEQGELVTEASVRQFFDQVKKEEKK